MTIKSREWSTKKTIVWGVTFFSALMSLGFLIAEIIRSLR